jgi:hypothetical protein
MVVQQHPKMLGGLRSLTDFVWPRWRSTLPPAILPPGKTVTRLPCFGEGILTIFASFQATGSKQAVNKTRITREEALYFLLTHIVVERNTSIELNQLTLFQLTNLAQSAVEQINRTEGIIPHEVIEQLAVEYLESK